MPVFHLQLLPSELAPYEDRGSLLAIMIAPEGATAGYTDRYIKMIEQLWDSVPEEEAYFTVTGFPVVNQGIGFMSFVDLVERTRSRLRDRPEPVGSHVRQSGPARLSDHVSAAGPGVRPDAGAIRGANDRHYEELQDLVNEIMAEAAEYPGLADLDTDLKLNKPELRIDVDRDKAADRGSRSSRSAARSRPCSAAGRSRASSSRASSMT